MQILALFFHMMKLATQGRLVSLQNEKHVSVEGRQIIRSAVAVGRRRRAGAPYNSHEIVKTIPVVFALI